MHECAIVWVTVRVLLCARARMSMRAVCRIEQGDPELTVADFAGSTIFALKAVALTEQLCAALKTSTTVKVCVCVCVCVRARACVRARVRACVCPSLSLSLTVLLTVGRWWT